MIKNIKLMTALIAAVFISILACGPAFAGRPDESALYRKFASLPPDVRNTSDDLIHAMNAEIKSGTAEVETYVLLAVAQLAQGDVENFMRNVKKANKKRFYKFQAHPLSRYQPFVNRFVNTLRTIREINNRMEIYPGSSMLYYQMALICREFDKKLAIKYLKQAISRYDDFLDAHLKLAELYEECMDYNRAIEEWRKIMDIRMYDFRPYYKICHLGSKMGNYTIAEEIYELGRRKKESLHEHKEFQEVIESLVADFPRMRDERKLAAEKLLKLKEVVQGDPLNIDALLDIAETYMESICDIRQAEQACVKAIHIDQLNYRPHLAYSKVLNVMGDTTKAYDELLFVVLEGGEKIKDGYLAEITDLCEKKLISDMIQKRLKIADMINYFSIYYNN